MQQLLTEGLILSRLATAGGIVVAYWCRNALVLAFPAQAPGIVVNFPGQIDWRVLRPAPESACWPRLFALAPALQVSKVDLADAINSGASGVIGGRGRSRVRSAFVLIQISLSFVLIAGAGLLMQSLRQIQRAPAGFSTEDVLLSGVDLLSAGYKPDRAIAFQDQLLERVEASARGRVCHICPRHPFWVARFFLRVDRSRRLPGLDPTSVQRPTTIRSGPITSRSWELRCSAAASSRATTTAGLWSQSWMRRWRRYWPGKDPVGGRFQLKDQWLEVIGVAKRAHYRTKLETAKPFFYVPLRQNFAVQGGLLIRTHETPAAITAALAEVVHALDPNLAPVAAITMQEHVNRGTYTQRLAVTLLAIFGGMALFLAAIGLYAVISYAVSQSTREIGLRMALGAGAADLLRMVMSRGLLLTGGGILIGMTIALLLTRLMNNLLYKVSPRDPLAFGLAFVVMTVVAFIACFLPAWRATRIDPVRALRA